MFVCMRKRKEKNRETTKPDQVVKLALPANSLFVAAHPNQPTWGNFGIISKALPVRPK